MSYGPGDSDDTGTIRGLTLELPPLTTTAEENHRFDALPWPGRTFMIVEKSSRRAIAMADMGGRVCLKSVNWDPNANWNQQWRCVQKRGWFGFFNPRSGKYLGHGRDAATQAVAEKHDQCEDVILRKHLDGGYELLTLHSQKELRVMEVASDGESLVARDDGTTLWEFVRV